MSGKKVLTKDERESHEQEGWYLLPEDEPGGGEKRDSRLPQCPDCDGQISKQATSCPHCGKPMPNVSSGTYAIWVAVAFLCALGAIFFIVKDNKRNAEIEDLMRNPPSSMEELDRRINRLK